MKDYMFLWSLLSIYVGTALGAQDLRNHTRYASVLAAMNNNPSYWEGPCSSSWAITVAYVATLEIKVGYTPSPTNVTLISYQHLMECCTTCYRNFANGCEGGDFVAAMDWMVANGSVSGGDYNSGPKYCKNYKIPECTLNVAANHASGMPICTDAALSVDTNPPVGTCTSTCDKGSTSSYTLYKAISKAQVVKTQSTPYFMAQITDSTAPKILITEIQVMEDLLTHDDPNRIYVHLYGRHMGTVVVAIFGYLVDPPTGQEYWIVKFPWGNQFGSNGFLKIYKGSNVSGIEVSGNAYYFNF